LSHTTDVALVEAGSGTFVMPTHSPYDRQLLREHVEGLAGRKEKLTLGVRGARWFVTRPIAMDSRCIMCAQLLGRLSCRRKNERNPTCIDCALQPGRNEDREGHDA
jgi:hypothetical protein